MGTTQHRWSRVLRTESAKSLRRQPQRDRMEGREGFEPSTGGLKHCPRGCPFLGGESRSVSAESGRENIQYPAQFGVPSLVGGLSGVAG
jgi:hypothetical protein